MAKPGSRWLGMPKQLNRAEQRMNPSATSPDIAMAALKFRSFRWRSTSDLGGHQLDEIVAQIMDKSSALFIFFQKFFKPVFTTQYSSSWQMSQFTDTVFSGNTVYISRKKWRRKLAGHLCFSLFFYYLTLIQKNSILISSFAGNPTKL